MLRTSSALAGLAILCGGLAAQDTTQVPPPATPATAITVEAVLTRGVLERMPQDTLVTVPADIGQVYLWSRVTGGEGQAVHHVWFHGDTQMADVALNINGSPYRTWSRKTITSDLTGPWRVEVRDSAGAVLATVTFTVEAAGMTP